MQCAKYTCSAANIIAFFLFLYTTAFYPQGKSPGDAPRQIDSLKEPVQKEFIVIAGGSHGGNYSKAAKFLTKYFSGKYPGKNFIYINSKGSVENIKLLAEKRADMAFVQRDILLRALYSENGGIKNLQVVAPAFEEHWFFYLNSRSWVSIEKLKKMIEKDSLHVGVTSLESTAAMTAREFFKYFGINENKIIYTTGDPEDLKKKLLKKELDAYISYTVSIPDLERNKRTNLLFFQKKEIEYLHSKIPNITPANFGKERYIPGIWSFIVAKTDKQKNLNGLELSLPDTIPENQANESKTFEILRQGYHAFKKLPPEKKEKLMDGIPVSEEFARIYQIESQNWRVFSYPLPFFLLSLLLVWRYIRKHRINLRLVIVKYWHRYFNIFAGLIIIIVLSIASVYGIIMAEKSFHERFGFSSSILNFTVKDLHEWLFIRNLTGIDGGISPVSTLGKLLISINMYLFRIGTGVIILVEYIFYIIKKKRKMGEMKINFENHIVIAGWNDSTAKFIINLVAAEKEYNGKKDLRIVVISTDPQKISTWNNEIEILFHQKVLHVIKGVVRHTKVMENANIEHANTVVLLAENYSMESDEHTLLRALAISRYCREKMIKNNKMNGESALVDNIYIIAEVNHDDFREDLYNAGVNEIITTSKYGRGTLLQSVFNHGVSKAMDEILEYNEYNDFYTIDLREKQNAHLRNKTFDELLVLLRRVNILLIGIKVVYYEDPEKTREIIDEKIISNKLKKEKLTRQVIVNPVNDIEKNRPADDDDQLLVLCTDGKTLRKGVKKVRGEAMIKKINNEC